MNYFRNEHDMLDSYFEGLAASDMPSLSSFKGAATSAVHTAAQQQLESLRKKYGIEDYQQKAKAYIQGQAEDIAKRLGADAAEKYLKTQGKALLKEAGKKIGVDVAQKYAQEFAQKFPNVPNIPIQLPTKLTVEGVEDAAYNTGKKYTENLIQNKIGFHIELPKKLTVGAISSSVESLLPHDAAQALNMTASIGLQVAAGAAASALTTLAAATAIGSAVPGLGTIIGLGVGLAAVALKNTFVGKALTTTACEHNKAMCRCKTPSGWKRPEPGKRSPVEMLPWIAQEQKKLSKIPRTPALCGVGPVPEAENWMGTLTDLILPYVGSTLPVMGLPSLERLLPQYEAASKLADPKKVSHQGDAASYILYGRSGSKNSLGAVTANIASPLATIRARVAFLKNFTSRLNQIRTTSDLSSLRWDLATELNNAIIQYTYNQTSDNKNWFVQLGTAFGKLEDEEARRQKEFNKQAKQNAATETKGRLDPAFRTDAILGNLPFACGNGNQQACELEPLYKAFVAKFGKAAAAPTVEQYDRFMKSSDLSFIKTLLSKVPTTAHMSTAKPPIKRSEQKVQQLKKEIVDLKKKAAEAKTARIKAEQAIRQKDNQRQQAVSAGFTPEQAAIMTQPLQNQTAAAVNQATQSAAAVTAQAVQVQKAAQAAQVPMLAVQQAIARRLVPAPQRPQLPFFQQFWPGAEPAQPAVPSDRPDLFLPFLRR